METDYKSSRFYYYNSNKEKESYLKIIAALFAKRIIGDSFKDSVEKFPTNHNLIDFSLPSFLFLFEPNNAQSGEPIVDYIAKQDEIQLILSNPNIFIILVSETKERENLIDELSSKEWLLSSEKSILDKTSNSFISYSFLTKDEIEKEEFFESYFKKVKIFYKCAIFDPTGIRRFLHFLLYDKKNDIYEGPYNAIIADDDRDTALIQAYFLYRLGYSVTIVNSWEELILMKEEIGNIHLLLLDEILKFNDHRKDYVEIYRNTDDIASGSTFIEQLGKNKEKALLVTGGDKIEGVKCIQKPIVDKFDLTIQFQNLKGNNIDVSHKYKQFTNNQSHQSVVKNIRDIYENIISNSEVLDKNKNYILFQIYQYDAYHIIKGRDGVLALQSTVELHTSEVYQICKYYPDKIDKQLWESRNEEINNMLSISFPELHRNNKRKKIKGSVQELNIQSLYRKQSLLRYIYEIMNDFAINTDLLSLLRVEILYIKKEIYKSSSMLWKSLLLQTKIIANKYLYSFTQLFFAWSFFVIIFGLIYYLIGINCSNPPILITSDLSIPLKSIAYSLAGGFGFAGFSGLQICCSYHQHVFLILNLFHSIISFILFIFLIDYLIQKMKEF